MPADKSARLPGVKWSTGPKYYYGLKEDTPWNHDLMWKKMCTKEHEDLMSTRKKELEKERLAAESAAVDSAPPHSAQDSSRTRNSSRSSISYTTGGLEELESMIRTNMAETQADINSTQKRLHRKLDAVHRALAQQRAAVPPDS